MKGKRAEIASTKTTTGGGNTEFDFGDCRNTAKLFIAWMICPLIWKLINRVKLLGGEGR